MKHSVFGILYDRIVIQWEMHFDKEVFIRSNTPGVLQCSDVESILVHSKFNFAITCSELWVLK